MRLLIALLLLLIPTICFSQTTDDVEKMLLRAELIRSEAQNLLWDLEAMKSVGTSSVSASSLTDIFDEVQKALKNMNLTMEELQRFIRTTSTAVENVSTTTNAQITGVGTALKDEITRLGHRLDSNLLELNSSIDKLILETSAFVKESKETLRDIRIASEKTVNFIGRLDGTLSVGLYGSEDGLDSEAYLTVWHRRNSASAHEFLMMGATDIDTDVKFDIQGGVRKGPMGIGFGFIEDGIGGSLFYTPVSQRGLDVRTSIYHLRDPFVDVKVGYTLGHDLRPFVFMDDILHDERLIGGGFSYGVGF